MSDLDKQAFRRRLDETTHRGLAKILEEQGFNPGTVAALLDIDAAMFRWRSLQAKAEFTSVVLQRTNVDLEPAMCTGLLAVARLTTGLDAVEPRAPTIGEVAEAMKIDPSRASRIVASLVDRGLLRRVADQSDGRKSVLEMTEAALEVMEKFRQAKWLALSDIYHDWPDEDIARFSVLLDRYITAMATLFGTRDPATTR